MANLIPVMYMNKNYPEGIKPKIVEIPAHFDVKRGVSTDMDYSLHTEYSYYERKFDSNFAKGLLSITEKVVGRGIPQLWFDNNWVNDFVMFIIRIVGEFHPPKVIEIHPPFNDYCNINKFVNIYKIFENKIKEIYPETEIHIENRNGSRYRKGKFIISRVEDINKLAELIDTENLKLKLVIDFPQLFSAHGIEIGDFNQHNLDYIFDRLESIRGKIGSIHLWGKCLGKRGRTASHNGTLNSLFYALSCENALNNFDGKGTKKYFLDRLYALLDDEIPRYFVPEVNKVQHIHSIVNDLVNIGFRFI